MSKQIWLAPILNNNRQRLIARAAEVLCSGPAEALLYIAASRPLLELAASQILDGIRNRGVWGSLPVHLFRGFARFVLATAVEDETGLPLTPRLAIDRPEFPLKRSLISQIIKNLAADGKLRAIAPLAGRDGCINSIATLLGEIERAGKTAAEFTSIIDTRTGDIGGTRRAEQPPEGERAVPRQMDFDREIALIYSAYEAALDGSGLTEDDADQLRTLAVLRGEVEGKRVSLPWLAEVRLLVLDGFFDFTPVQGEILRLLIPQVPEVIVNLNRDQRNAEVFRPFDQTTRQLGSMAEFEVIASDDAQPVAEALSPLRERLFSSRGGDAGWPPLTELGPLTGNPVRAIETVADAGPPLPERQAAPERGGHLGPPLHGQDIKLLECSNRQTEVRAIARQVKRLVLTESFTLGDIAVVVRERAPYEATIARIFQEEGIPCSISRTMPAAEIPSVRAALKLIEILIDRHQAAHSAAKLTELAGLIKSGYFRLSEDDVSMLATRFERDWAFEPAILASRGQWGDLRLVWDADQIENVIAHVGGELRVDKWLTRARLLAGRREEMEGEDLIDAEDEPEPEDESLVGSEEQLAGDRRRDEQVEFFDVPLPGSERKEKPKRDVDPGLIAWVALIVERFSTLIASLPLEGTPRELRSGVMKLMDSLQFSAQVRGSSLADPELPSLALDLRGLESLRRALSSASRSFEIAPGSVSTGPVKLAHFLDEVIRSLRVQSLLLNQPDPGGLKVLEATDVRGLRFRAVFIAGLIEGGFPLRPSRDWIYPHEEREQLKRYGLTLEDISPDTLLKEEHYFYQAACRATERLYLSRPLVLEDGTETVASYYIEELRRALRPIEIERELVRNDFDGRTLFESTRASELAISLVRQDERRRHRAQSRGNFPGEVIARLIGQASGEGVLTESARRRIEVERERGSHRFGRFDGQIKSIHLISQLADHYDSRHEFSASELSLYGKCPFKFFAEKVLRLEPRGEAAMDLTALDAGSLLHEVLRRFFEKHRGQRLPDLERSRLKEELNEIADAVFNEHQQAVPPLNPQVWSIDRQIRKLILQQVLDYELELQEKTRAKDVKPAYFELGFGMRGGAVDPASKDQLLELRRESEQALEVVRVRGQIDRVDLGENDTAIAYDYKLSRGASLGDMKEGRALQLHIYLAALEQIFLPGCRIAGAGYYTMKGGQPSRNQGLYRADMNAYTGVDTRTASSLADEEWRAIREQMESRIWEFIDSIRRGRFVVLPSAPGDTCPHCDYSAVCRYEKFRISAKRDAT